jgi:anti-sigma B factor antagonist
LRVVGGLVYPDSPRTRGLGAGLDAVGTDRWTARSGRNDPVKIKQRSKDDVTILDISGKIMGGDDFDLFNNTIKSLVVEGKVDIVLNLSKVKWINSTGLGLMVSAYTSLVKQGGRMKIAEVSERIDNILHVTQLELIFETFDDEEKAVASFEAL